MSVSVMVWAAMVAEVVRMRDVISKTVKRILNSCRGIIFEEE